MRSCRPLASLDARRRRRIRGTAPDSRDLPNSRLTSSRTSAPSSLAFEPHERPQIGGTEIDRVISLIALIVHNRFVKPRRETDIGSASCGPAVLVGTPHTCQWLRSHRYCRAHGGLVKRANISNSDFVSKQMVQMDVDLRRSVHGYVHVLVTDHVLRNDRAQNRRAATRLIDVDSHFTWRCGVRRVEQDSRRCG